ncbi:MAG TPA: NADH-quinone oxidoreductase subunit J [Microthrixaceae bacterium]|nr:NADH-quinone oxidoreductase subunit J [Microthrixaceae bacterium]
MKVEMFTFLVSAAICLGGALGVVLLRNAVHNALSLIATLFGIAVLFMTLDAYFLAAVQVIVYAGAIVVLFLFVIMLLGVDKIERFDRDAIIGQRPAALVVGLAILGLSVTALLSVGSQSTGRASSLAAPDAATPDINSLAKLLFTDYVFALEITSVLLTIAVIGAVVLARRGGAPIDLDEFPDGPAVVDPPEVDPADVADADSDSSGSDSSDSDSALSTEEASR